MNFGNLFIAAAVGVVLAGCANMDYDKKLSDVSVGIQTGNVKGSLDMLQGQHGGASADNDKDKATDLLYHLEVGELKRLNGDVQGSSTSWLKADKIVKGWEEQAKLDPLALLGDVGSVLINDTTRRYDGRDYEKVLLSVDLALNHLALNDFDSARIEIRKMHQRQAVIADFQAKVLQKAADDAAEKNVKVTSFKELGGYPIETLEAPEVQSLKNSYESAFGNYLAGFVYEALGDSSLAAPGYRKAIEMRPHVPMLEKTLAELDKRSSYAQRSKSDDVDVLFVVESGLAPAVTTQKIALPLPIPTRQGVRLEIVPLSWPVIRPGNGNYLSAINIDDSVEPLVMLTSVNAMARRALYDEMPAILTRTTVRAIAKVAAQKATDEAASQAGLVGSLFSIATKVAVTVSEVADERVWRTLPDSFLIARKKIKSGTHQIAFNVNGVPTVRNVSVSGKYAVVTARVVGNQVYINAQNEGVVGSSGNKASEAVVSR